MILQIVSSGGDGGTVNTESRGYGDARPSTPLGAS
jgi:hypothetical protein